MLHGFVRPGAVSMTGMVTPSVSKPQVAASIADEDRLRAATYGLLGRLLAGAPDAETLKALRSIDAAVEADGLTGVWARLGTAARSATPADLTGEYQRLFIGIGRGELVPYASWYLTGFLMERPLGILRRDLDTLGIQRQDSVREPEDHIAALCEVMSLLITDPDYDVERAQDFFTRHLSPWAERFFADLEQAVSSRFYHDVGELGRHFIALEQQYLEGGG